MRNSAKGIKNNESNLQQYNLTVTAANWTTVRAIGIPYQTINGTWRLKFNIDGSTSGGVTTLAITIAGITFRAAVNQNISLIAIGSAPYTASGRTQSGSNGIFDIYCSSSTIFYIYGDVELNAKPTFVS